CVYRLRVFLGLLRILLSAVVPAATLGHALRIGRRADEEGGNRDNQQALHRYCPSMIEGTAGARSNPERIASNGRTRRLYDPFAAMSARPGHFTKLYIEEKLAKPACDMVPMR